MVQTNVAVRSDFEAHESRRTVSHEHQVHWQSDANHHSFPQKGKTSRLRSLFRCSGTDGCSRTKWSWRCKKLSIPAVPAGVPFRISLSAHATAQSALGKPADKFLQPYAYLNRRGCSNDEPKCLELDKMRVNQCLRQHILHHVEGCDLCRGQSPIAKPMCRP